MQVLDEEVYLTLKSFENRQVEINYMSKFDTEEHHTGTCMWVGNTNMYITENGLNTTIQIPLMEIISIRCIE